tara:strand:+ start:11647 stop:12261 length:615 start_codon:yes stop_codon:yes gene_type:complete
MESTYQPELWRDLFVMIGSSAAALVGLLFIVVTLHFNRIVEREDRNTQATIKATQFNTVHLLIALVVAVTVLIPQPLALMGAELIAVNLFGLRAPLVMTYKYLGRNISISARGGFPTVPILTIMTAYLIGIAGGVSLLGRSSSLGLFDVLVSVLALDTTNWTALVNRPDWGLHLVAISCTIILVRAVLNAWTLMFGVSPSMAAK